MAEDRIMPDYQGGFSSMIRNAAGLAGFLALIQRFIVTGNDYRDRDVLRIPEPRDQPPLWRTFKRLIVTAGPKYPNN
jgi:hypothetical protein